MNRGALLNFSDNRFVPGKAGRLFEKCSAVNGRVIADVAEDGDDSCDCTEQHSVRSLGEPPTLASRSNSRPRSSACNWRAKISARSIFAPTTVTTRRFTRLEIRTITPSDSRWTSRLWMRQQATLKTPAWLVAPKTKDELVEEEDKAEGIIPNSGRRSSRKCCIRARTSGRYRCRLAKPETGTV